MTSHRDISPVDTLWLGLHKTGTTFLQKSLDLSQQVLRERGVHYQELDVFRKDYTRPLLHVDHPAPPAPRPKPFPGLTQFLVFDENIPALVQHALGPEGLYPDAAPRARLISDHLGLIRPRLVLGLRGYRTFLPSLYCEALKSTAFRRFRKFCVTPTDALSWDNLVGRLTAQFPQSEILIYTAEALRGHERSLLSSVTGVDGAGFTLLEQAERPGFSNKAVRALHEISKARPVTREDVSQQTRLFPRGPGTAGFDPWTPEEATDLDRRYAADLDRLIKRPDVTFLDPELLGS